MVRDADQAWHWITYWNTMRGVPVEDFTLCEFLPGRDFSVQAIWHHGRLVLMKMCERLSYLNATQSPSGMASTPALAKTVWEPAKIAPDVTERTGCNTPSLPLRARREQQLDGEAVVDPQARIGFPPVRRVE